jgi:fructose-bisphosphate aldolase, class I
MLNKELGMQNYLPGDVPNHMQEKFSQNFQKATGGSGRLMLFAGDQKVEHLNRDFFGEEISPEDNDPEHLFKIASNGHVGVFAAQFGLISRYARSYCDIPYLIKLNSKTNLTPYDAADPLSKQWISIQEVVQLQENCNINVLGIGYTVYLGGKYESLMLAEAAKAVHEAHANGMLAVLWIYPKGTHVKDEHDADLIAGAAGVGAALGADFVKLKVPYADGTFDPQLLHRITAAAGRTGILCEGGDKIGKIEFLEMLHEQIHTGNARGNGTGRNIHQRPLKEAVKMANAIYSVTVNGASVTEAAKILEE